MNKITLVFSVFLISYCGYAQLSENFDAESVASPVQGSGTWVLPSGTWHILGNEVGDNDWTLNLDADYPSNSGTKAAFIDRENIGDGNTSIDFLVTPLISVPEFPQLRFQTRTTVALEYATTFEVRAAPGSADPSNMSAYTTLLASWTEENLTAIYNVYEEKVVNIPANIGTDIYIAFVKTYTQEGTTIGGERWLVDDVRVLEGCYAPDNLAVSPLSTSAFLSWDNPGPATQWNVVVLPTGIALNDPSVGEPIVTTANTNFAVSQTTQIPAANLVPQSQYIFYVQASCTDLSSEWIASEPFTTQAIPPKCGEIFTDESSTNGNYLSNANSTITICPDAPGEAVVVTFTSFEVQELFDGLYVYDGNTVTSPQIPSSNTAEGLPFPGAFWGFGLPGPFEATNAEGCLTFNFISNSVIEYAGFEASISCVPLSLCPKPTNPVLGISTDTTIPLTWNPSGQVTQWVVFAVPCGAEAPNLNSPGGQLAIAAPTPENPFIISNLSPDTCYDIYILPSCPSSEPVTPLGPIAAHTQLQPPSCGDLFTDAGGANGNYPAESNSVVTICPDIAGEVVTVTFSEFSTTEAFDGMYIYDGDSTSAEMIASENGAGISLNLTEPGAYWGTDIPAAFEATNSSGCLTFHFSSEIWTTGEGWQAQVSCGPASTCPKPTALALGASTDTTVEVLWTPEGTANQWKIFAVPCGGPVPTIESLGGQLASEPPTPENPFLLTDLNPLTCYQIYIFAMCQDSETSKPAGPKTITTQVGQPVCGGSFTDPGGSNNYAANTDYSVTICPENEGEVVTVLFSDFSINPLTDGLYIFDGNSIAAPIIASGNPPGENLPALLEPGAYWGSESPGAFQASGPTGCLTFHFVSAEWSSGIGWLANVNCGLPSSCPKPTTLQLGVSTNNTIPANWISSGDATQWKVYAVPCGSAVPDMDTSGGQFATAAPTEDTPFVITGLLADSCYDVYVFAVCPDSSGSIPAGPVEATTQLAPPVCGGLFTDAGGAMGKYSGGADSIIVICPENEGDVVTVAFTDFNLAQYTDGMYIYNGDSVMAEQILSENAPGSVSNLAVPGAFWGDEIPGTFVATNATGCLTFHFLSDTWSFDYDGWIANVSCSPAPSCLTPTQLSVSDITQGSATVSWVEMGAATQWQVLILPAFQPAPDAEFPGWQNALSQPFLYEGLTSGTHYKAYVRAVCSEDDYSPSSYPSVFTTPITNDECIGAIDVPVNADLDCTNTISGSLLDATPSSLGETCYNSLGNDIWFRFVATEATHSFTFTDVIGNTALYAALYSGNCDGVALSSCMENMHSSGNVAGNLVPGETYYLKLYSLESASPVFFDLCIGTPPPPITVSDDYTAEQLVSDILLPSICGSVSNITSSTGTDFGSLSGIGYFNRNGSDFGLEQGVLLTTNNVHDIPGPDLDVLHHTSIAGLWPGDDELAAIYSEATGIDAENGNNASILEFDFIPETPYLSFRYIFASEGYGYAQCYTYNAFGFLLTDLTAGGPVENHALVPNTTLPISEQTIRDQYYNPSGLVDYCQSENEEYFDKYYGANSFGGNYLSIPGSISPLAAPTDFHGLTVPLTATATLIPGHTYHFKLVISDVNYSKYDAGVFIEAFNLGNTINLGADASLCAGSSYTLSTGLDDEEYTFVWTKNGDALEAQDNSLTVTESGTYAVTAVYGDTGCTATDEVHIGFDAPIVLDPVSDITACGLYTIPVPNVGHYYSGANGTGDILDNTAIDSPGNTHVYLYAASGSDCFSQADFTVSIIPLPLLPDIEDVVSCQEYTLPVLGQVTYYNGPGATGGVVGTVTQTQQVFAYLPGSSGQCFAEKEFTVTIGNQPILPEIPNVISCGEYQLPAMGEITYYNASGATGGIVTTVTASQTVYAYLGGNSPECFSEQAFTVTISEMPELPEVANVTSCGTYTLPPIAGVTYYNAAAAGGGEIDTVTSTQQVYAYVSGTSPDCWAESSFDVVITDVPQLAIAGGCEGNAYTLTVSIANFSQDVDYTYDWTTEGGEITSGSHTPQIVVVGPGIYSVAVTVNQEGCGATQWTMVAGTTCMIQKGISVNGDGLNDTFDLDGFNVERLEIFNRYGMKVYEQSPYTNQWGGQSDSGKMLPDGTYYYIINLKTGDPKTGWIYLTSKN